MQYNYHQNANAAAKFDACDATKQEIEDHDSFLPPIPVPSPMYTLFCITPHFENTFQS